MSSIINFGKKLKCGETHASRKTLRTSSPGVSRVLQVLLDACTSLIFYFSLKLETTHSPDSRPLLSHLYYHIILLLLFQCQSTTTIFLGISLTQKIIFHQIMSFLGWNHFWFMEMVVNMNNITIFIVIILWVGNVQYYELLRDWYQFSLKSILPNLIAFIFLMWNQFNNCIAKWRLDAWNILELALLAASSKMETAKPDNPVKWPHAPVKTSTHYTDKKGKVGRRRKPAKHSTQNGSPSQHAYK